VQLFEGIKAFRGLDNHIRIFRPDMNMKRMARTVERTCLPAFDTTQLLACMSELIRLDRDWVPSSTRSALYIRPTMIGCDPTLGVSYSKKAMLYVLLGPVGAYFPTGFKPITLYADPVYVRAAPGGAGAYKMGSNYAPTILISKRASDEHGAQQVLWLYGPDERLTEVGTMNIFAYLTNEKGGACVLARTHMRCRKGTGHAATRRRSYTARCDARQSVITCTRWFPRARRLWFIQSQRTVHHNG
jgi:branched-chain amino acid aminotransferase